MVKRITSGMADKTSETSKGKRKPSDDPRDIFKSSKVVLRSPRDEQKTSRGDEEQTKDLIKQILDEVIQMREENRECNRKIDKLQEEVRELKAEIKSAHQKVKEMEDNMQGEIEQLNVEVKMTQQRMESVEDRLEKYDKDNKKKNIVIRGLKIEETESNEIKENIESFIKKNIQVNARVVSVHKIGEEMWVAQMNSFENKIEVMKNKKKLRGYKKAKVYVDSDLTVNERETQKKIIDIAKMERQKGRKVRIGYNRINIDGVDWIWNKRENGLEERRPPAKN